MRTPLTRPALLAFLRSHRYAVQSSTHLTGAPQSAVVGIAASDDFEIVFDTLASSRKAINLRHHSPIAFVIGRLLEDGLRAIVRRVPVLASPFAPLVAGALMIVAGLVAWSIRSWETARVLPLRAPIIAVVAAALVVPLWRPARGLEVL